MPDVASMGEALIDFVPGQVDCRLEEVRDFTRAPGGAPANVAVGLARLGINAGFMGKVGADAFGRFLTNTLVENGVDTSQMVQTEEAMTTLAFVSLRSDGERDFAFYRKPGADMLYRMEDIDRDYLQQARIFHFGSISLIAEPARTTTLELVRQARENGLLVSYDPNLRPPLWDSLNQARQEIQESLPLADILKVNEEELEFLTDIDLDFSDGLPVARLTAGCQQLSEKGAGLIIVTLGSWGSFYYHNGQNGYVKGVKVKAIDTTGAGDAFVAAVLSRLIEGQIDDLQQLGQSEIEEILGFANRVASVTTTRNGGIPSLPEKSELED